MTLSQQAADAIASAAGWRPAKPDDDGVFRFHLEGDLEMDFFSPDGRTGVFRSTLATLPDSEAEADELLRICAQRAVAAGRKRKSVVSLDDGRLQLHRTVRLDGLSPDMLARLIPHEARDFLNDLAWWRVQAGTRTVQAAPSSPFSMAGFGGSWSPGR
jgi:hypothetical protein